MDHRLVSGIHATGSGDGFAGAGWSSPPATRPRGGGPGTLVSLPRGVPHTLRVPSGTARFLMLTVGAPSATFLREVGEAYAAGPTLEQLVEIAGRHGVRPAFDLPGT